MIDGATDLHPTTWRTLRALRAGVKLSRNRHFALFQDAHVRRAVKLHRFLRSVAADVRRYSDGVSVAMLSPESPRGEDAQRGDYVLRLDIRRLHGTRTAYLTALELSLLAEDAPQVAQLLDTARGEAAEVDGADRRR